MQIRYVHLMVGIRISQIRFPLSNTDTKGILGAKRRIPGGIYFIRHLWH